MKYEEFIVGKTQEGAEHGFAPIEVPDKAFDFQRDLIDWTLRKGRGACFADCGMGKTLVELAWANNVYLHTGKPALILTPLAVSAQTIREGEKFGIECTRSSEGKAFPVTITNYERLHYFSPDDFAGVVCDECFAKGTEVDTPTGRMYIENIQEGDRILNAAGVDVVSDVHRREVPYAVKVTIGSRSCIASPNHPFFTQRGWVGAQDIRPGDYALETAASVRMVREGVLPQILGAVRAEILRDILLSELEDESARIQSKDEQPGVECEARQVSFGVAQVGSPEGYRGTGEDYCTESNLSARGSRQDIPPIESHEARTFRAWGQRSWFDSASKDSSGCSRKTMGSGVQFVTGEIDSRLSDALQVRLGASREKNLYRGGWLLPCSPSEEGPRREEGGTIAFVRVDGMQVLQPGDTELERLRSADGKLYFYDLGATRHPSFSVGGYLVHNSSILKSFDGSRRTAITEFMRKVPYRLLATATAAPNDYIELGTSSEALGYMGYMDMLGRFFRNERDNCATKRMYGEAPKWRLKGHADQPFWRWVTSWARAVRKPSDLGYEDGGFILPPLHEVEHIIDTDSKAPGMLFNLPAANLFEQREERKRTIDDRCARVASLVNGTGQPAMVWCHLNDEGDLLERLIPDAVQVSGSDSDETKERHFLDFASGKARVLVTKPKIGAWGLNFQHCNHIVYFPSHSFEQYYQAVRRCWRFGQERPVTVDIVLTEGERKVMDNLRRKATAADDMFASLVREMNNSLAIQRRDGFNNREKVPTWL